MVVRLMSTATSRNTIGNARPMDSMELTSDLSELNPSIEARVCTYQRALATSSMRRCCLANPLSASLRFASSSDCASSSFALPSASCCSPSSSCRPPSSSCRLPLASWAACASSCADRVSRVAAFASSSADLVLSCASPAAASCSLAVSCAFCWSKVDCAGAMVSFNVRCKSAFCWVRLSRCVCSSVCLAASCCRSSLIDGTSGRVMPRRASSCLMACHVGELRSIFGSSCASRLLAC